MLIVFGGLSGTGKTTVAREFAGLRPATYLRIDAIEQALRSADVLTEDVGAAGYMVAYALAKANLKLGQIVVPDCVNPLAVTRAAWRAVAESVSVPIVEVEIICSDAGEHRRRVENRIIDVPGLTPPTWASVLSRDYEPWTRTRVVIDTTFVSPREAALRVCAEVDARGINIPELSRSRNDR